MIKISAFFENNPYPGLFFSVPMVIAAVTRVAFCALSHLSEIFKNRLYSFYPSAPLLKKIAVTKKMNLPFPPFFYQTSFSRNEQLSLTIYDVAGNGNCFFYALHLSLQALNHPKKNLTPENLRQALTDYLLHNLGKDPDIELKLRLELSEIADQKKAMLQSRLLSLKKLRLEALTKSEDTKLTQGVEFWSDVAATCYLPNSEDAQLMEMIDSQIKELAYEIGQPGVWVGYVALDILAKILNIHICVHNPAPHLPIVYEAGDPCHPKVDLLRAPNHYLTIIYD